MMKPKLKFVDNECNLAPICNDHKKFVGVRMQPRCLHYHSLALVKIRNNHASKICKISIFATY